MSKTVVAVILPLVLLLARQAVLPMMLLLLNLAVHHAKMVQRSYHRPSPRAQVTFRYLVFS